MTRWQAPRLWGGLPKTAGPKAGERRAFGPGTATTERGPLMPARCLQAGHRGHGAPTLPTSHCRTPRTPHTLHRLQPAPPPAILLRSHEGVELALRGADRLESHERSSTMPMTFDGPCLRWPLLAPLTYRANKACLARGARRSSVRARHGHKVQGSTQPLLTARRAFSLPFFLAQCEAVV